MSLGRLSSSLKEDAYDWGQLLSLSPLAPGKSLPCWVSASSGARPPTASPQNTCQIVGLSMRTKILYGWKHRFSLNHKTHLHLVQKLFENIVLRVTTTCNACEVLHPFPFGRTYLRSLNTFRVSKEDRPLFTETSNKIWSQEISCKLLTERRKC